MNMRWSHLRQSDMNLLVAFAVFAEELSVTAAARRLLLSQPAASRMLERLRAQFGDDLLVRGPKGYQLTPTGVRLKAELDRLLPQIEELIGRRPFDPSTEAASFRITGADNTCATVCGLFAREVLPAAPRVEVNFVPYSEEALSDLDRGRVDLVLSNDDVLVPSHLESRRLYRESWHCIAAAGGKLPKSLSLERYLAAEHIAVSTLAGVQSIPDKRLAALGLARMVRLRMPYFGAALECVAGTNLMLTATSGVAQAAKQRGDLRVLGAPRELAGFGFLAVWHPRLTSDPGHTWLRERLVELTRALSL
ncbi:MAG: LysR family transcriptional regulator [Edaphobacter sp.]|uniref:LysR family transcriptional regulator n=1 Tax=Edaphobacter sp. TaxID=1934404 RepID=UPI00238C1AF6|nr:LysR family transcriptional regulator [Edaphobacter sp.]MDE1177656.1 LysR family transcriptional regulator [Edaphobacter sp.]